QTGPCSGIAWILSQKVTKPGDSLAAFFRPGGFIGLAPTRFVEAAAQALVGAPNLTIGSGQPHTHDSLTDQKRQYGQERDHDERSSSWTPPRPFSQSSEPPDGTRLNGFMVEPALELVRQ